MFNVPCTVEYRPIPGFDGYRVGNDGSVWSCKRNRWGLDAPWRRLATKVQSNGYEYVGLWKENQRTLKRVQVFVLEAFVGLRPEGMWALHRNDNPLDNRLDNLYWGTHEENIRDAKMNGRFQGPKELLPLSDVQAIRQLTEQGMNYTAIAMSLGLGREAVRSIVKGRRRKNVC